MSKSKKSLGEPKEYDYRMVPGEVTWNVEVFKSGEWKFVALFFSEKTANDWLKGGVPSYRFKS